ncbi:hypothetical protein [Haliangium ochraceum]|uniref:DUF2306 domain-containing protein n=1 Tax=Haliangium ochraceum (strain DSM 14365 / JCM 11303 / SMP-2) TaxID=502025 RepID=D0LSR7_HALO1|nr:hypothetical protein [Haliangium ochraceum]ACY17289.1 conserved hypothetical protein [Haliangium ochraceum DSM 14365]
MNPLDLYAALVRSHAFFGILGLLAAFVPLLGRKGGALHRRAGWTFVLAMLFTAVSGIVIAALWMAVPLSLRSSSAALSPGDAARLVANARIFAALLMYLAVLILSALWHGVRAMRVRRRAAATRELGGHLLDHALPWLMFAGGIALAGFGLFHAQIVHIAFGILGGLGGYQDLRVMQAPPQRGRPLLIRHLEAMISACIAAATAFLVFGARHWLDGLLPSSLAFLPWLAPSALGMLLIAKYKRRFRPVAV